MSGHAAPQIGRLDPDQRHDLLAATYAKWSADVYGFVLVRSGDRSTAADVTTEVFIAAARAVGGDKPEQVTRSWLLTTARRRLIDQWRRQGSQRRTVDRLLAERSDEAAPTVDPALVRAALDSLPDNQRLALTLRYLDDLSVSEIADELGLSYRATESVLARGRRSFKRAWEKQ